MYIYIYTSQKKIYQIRRQLESHPELYRLSAENRLLREHMVLGLFFFQNFLAVWNIEYSRFVTGFVCFKAMLVQQKASVHQEQSSDTFDTFAFAC